MDVNGFSHNSIFTNGNNGSQTNGHHKHEDSFEDNKTGSNDSDNFEPSDELSVTHNEKESAKYNPFVTFKTEPAHFKELGFWATVNSPEPEKAFEDFLKEVTQFHDARRADLNISHLFDLERFEESISRAEEEIENLRLKLKEQKDEIPEIETEIKNLRKKIEETETKLAEAYKKLGIAKSELIEKRISDAFGELDNLIDKYREVAKKHGEINEEARMRNPGAFEIKPSLLKHLHETYTRALDRMRQKESILGQSGNWATNPWYLKIFGILAAFSAGYFFSIFAVEQKLGNSSISFFVITGLFNFLGTITQSISAGYFIAMLLVLTLPFLVLMIAFLCQRALEKRKERQEGRVEDLKVALNESNEVLITEVNEDLYTFLLKNTPFFFVLSVGFALVTFGYLGAASLPQGVSAQLEALSISLSSFTMGTYLALALAGVIYIYIIKIVEPGLVKTDSKDEVDDPVPKRSRFITNIELVGAAAVVLVLVFILLMGLEKNFFFNITKILQNKKSFIAMALFVASILMTAFTFGYGMYFSGLIEAKLGVERRLKFLTQKLSYNSFPNIRLALMADKTFGLKYVEIANKLLQLILDKTQLAKEFVPNNEKRTKHNPAPVERPNYSKFLPKFLIKYFRDNRTDEQRYRDNMDDIDKRRVNLPPEDINYFPEITTEIKGIDDSLGEQRKQLLSMETDVKNRQEEKSDYIKKLKEDKEKFEERMKDWNKHLSFLNREQFKEIGRFEKACQKEIADLNDGYNMALWFMDGGGTPPHKKTLRMEKQNGQPKPPPAPANVA